MFYPFLSCYSKLSLYRRGPGGLKGQVKMFYDLVYDFVLFDK